MDGRTFLPVQQHREDCVGREESREDEERNGPLSRHGGLAHGPMVPEAGYPDPSRPGESDDRIRAKRFSTPLRRRLVSPQRFGVGASSAIGSGRVDAEPQAESNTAATAARANPCMEPCTAGEARSFLALASRLAEPLLTTVV